MSTPAQVAFNNGDVVTVRIGNPPTHYRTPVYVQGKTGRVVALCGIFPDAESLAHGGSGQPYKPLYRVEFPRPTCGTITTARPPTGCRSTSTSSGWKAPAEKLSHTGPQAPICNSGEIAVRRVGATLVAARIDRPR